MQIGFSNNHCTLRAQTFRDGRILLRDITFFSVEASTGSAAESFEVETIFQRNRQPVQRRFVINGAKFFQRAICFTERTIFIQREVNISSGVLIRVCKRLLGKPTR